MIANPGGLEVRLDHRVHPGLRLEVALSLGNECGILFGPSGSGKSTILRLIAGLTRPDGGFIGLNGSTLFDSSAGIRLRLRDRQVGLIFQDDLLFPHLDVEKNVRFGLKRWHRRAADERLAGISGLCGIGHLLDRRPSTLSGGERQRVGLARALAPRPRLLLCDEPVSALDLESRYALIDRIKRVQRAESIPVLYVTHSPDEAFALGSRLFLLSGGRIVAEGPPLDVLASNPSGGTIGRASFRNVFEATVEAHDLDDLSTSLRIVGGPLLVVPRVERPPGSSLTVTIQADDIVLARGPIGALSARNLIGGTIERVVTHGSGAEVVVRTGEVTWVVGVASATIGALGLSPGEEVRMIVKSRSCRMSPEERP